MDYRQEILAHIFPQPATSIDEPGTAKFSQLVFHDPHWATEDAEIKVPSVENPELTNVLPALKPGVGQNIATHASPTSTFPVHSPSFVSKSSPSLAKTNIVAGVGPRNKSPTSSGDAVHTSSSIYGSYFGGLMQLCVHSISCSLEVSL